MERHRLVAIASRLPTGLYRCPGCGLETRLHPPDCTRLWCSRCDAGLERIADLPRRRVFDQWRGVWVEERFKGFTP